MKGAKSKMVLIATIIIITFSIYSIICCLAIAEDQNSRADMGENEKNNILLEAQTNKLEIQPSKTVSYEIFIRNFGEENLTYYPPIANTLNLPIGWTITFSPDTDIFIPEGKYHVMFVNLTAASDADANTVVELILEGTTSAQNTKIYPATISAKVTQIFKTELSAKDTITFSSPTEQQNFVITVSNDGNGDDRLAIELEDFPKGLSFSAEVQEFIIGPGITENLTFNIFPSSFLTAGNYELNISLYRISLIGKEWVSSHSLVVEIQYYPDLNISYGDIELSKYAPSSGDDITINITIHNIGDSDARNFIVSIIPKTRFGSKLDSIDETVTFLGLGESKTLHIPWRADKPAVNLIQVILDSNNTVGELNESNNAAEYNIYIVPPPKDEAERNELKIGDYSLIQLSAVAIVALLGGIVVTSIVSTEYGKYAIFKLLLPFYTRVKKEEVLNHEVRELVYDYVQSHPGEHFRAILTKLGLTNGTLIHHLHTLERQNFIKSERDGPFKRFYPKGRNLTEDVLEINGIQLKIIDAVKTNPGIIQKDLARMLKTSPPTINYHVKALHMVRLLNLKRDGKNTRCFPGASLNGWYKSGGVA